MNLNLNNAIKAILAFLLFLCLADMPYGFYHLVRFVGLIGFGFLAIEAKKYGRQQEMVIYIVLGLLFQPFFKVALGRQIWNIIDVIVGLGLIVSFIIKPESKNNGC